MNLPVWFAHYLVLLPESRKAELHEWMNRCFASMHYDDAYKCIVESIKITLIN